MPGSWVRVPPLLLASQSLPSGWLESVLSDVPAEVPISRTFSFAFARAPRLARRRSAPGGRARRSGAHSARTLERPFAHPHVRAAACFSRYGHAHSATRRGRARSPSAFWRVAPAHRGRCSSRECASQRDTLRNSELPPGISVWFQAHTIEGVFICRLKSIKNL